MSELSSAERKRIRDRRSQQTLRAKKEQYTRQLEAKVAYCEQHHSDKGAQQLIGIIKSLRKQNEILVARHNALKLLVNSWEDTTEDSEAYTNAWVAQGVNDKSPSSLVQTSPEDMDMHSPVANTPPISSLPPISSAATSPASFPLWNQLPLYSDDFSSYRTVSLPWFFFIEQITNCPDTPASPLEILYGSKSNPLANMIHLALEKRPIREPEKLALGWITYHISRWIVAPSPKTFAALPSCMHPAEEQLKIEHPLALSCIPWPKMRSNVIRQWPFYNSVRDELFGMFTCCIKIRWPWGVNVLERNEHDDLCIKPAFYETFMSEQGWGITPEFLSKYPRLADGLDVNSVIFTVV
ncbi:hypothetical protein N7490_006432 [Penicillium lividum]|nr:hypothetical protein N7490_006432 [Penicillium lividum]